MARWLYAMAQGAARRRRLVVVIWLAVVLALGGLAAGFRGELSTTFSLPGIEAQRAQDLLAEEFPAASGGTYRVVFEAPAGATLTDAATQAVVADSLARAATVEGVISVGQLTISPGQAIGFADVQFAAEAQEVPAESKEGVEAAMAPATDAGLRVAYGGTASAEQVQVAGIGEALGIVVAAVVLLVTLGSLVVAGLPLLTALVGVAAGVFGILIVSGFVDLASVSLTLALMIGLAVGIDYALFIVARHREQLADPRVGVDDSIGRAIGTAGSAVVFAGLTVIIALSALAIARIPFLTTMGLAAAGTVAVAVVVALTLIPALLGFVGERARPRAARRAAATAGATAPVHPATGTSFWGRWARLIQRAPVAFVAVPLVVLLFLSLPVLNLRLGLPGNETLPEDSTQYQSYELLTEGFGPGFNATVLYVIDGQGIPADQLQALGASVAQTIQATPDVAAVTGPIVNPAGTVAILSVVPLTGPDDEATASLVDALRDAPREQVQAAGAVDYVGGITPLGIDISDRLADALPLFIAVIVLLALVLLLVAFRSVLVPLKAVIGFLLTIGASVGLTVWVFQEGNFAELFGVTTPAPIVAFIPIILIGVLFGLAMDYEVFLVSRMREEFHHTGDAAQAVLRGLGESGRVVCAAALIMASVFGGFLLGHDPIIKSIAFALAIGVLIDAFVVRMTIVPAVMFLLGRRAWALPRWLDRVVPNVDIEGASLPPLTPAAPAPAASPDTTPPTTSAPQAAVPSPDRP